MEGVDKDRVNTEALERLEHITMDLGLTHASFLGVTTRGPHFIGLPHFTFPYLFLSRYTLPSVLLTQTMLAVRGINGSIG